MKAPPAPGAHLDGGSLDGKLRRLHRELRGCTRCVEAGLLDRAVPVLPASLPSRLVLVGQAPGRVEEGAGRPFSGRAGRQLFGWLERGGLGSEEEARRRVYLTSITKCFPGVGAGGSGDRRPARAEVELCRPHLDRQLGLLQPWLVLAVGQLALERFLPGRRLGELVGRVFDARGEEAAAPARAGRLPLILPLPHPSGASRWLNQIPNRALLEAALELLRRLVAEGRPRSPA